MIFAIFNKLYHFYYRHHFYFRYETYPNLQGRPLAINTELQGSRAVQKCQVKHPQFGDFYFFIIKKTLIFKAQFLNEDER